MGYNHLRLRNSSKVSTCSDKLTCCNAVLTVIIITSFSLEKNAHDLATVREEVDNNLLQNAVSKSGRPFRKPLFNSARCSFHSKVILTPFRVWRITFITRERCEIDVKLLQNTNNKSWSAFLKAVL